MVEYEVTKRINAIISVNVNASNREEAVEKAEKEFNKGYFKSNISYLDGQGAIVGVNNNDLWNTEIE